MFRQHNHPWWKSFLYAMRGVRRVFLRERNFRFHIAASIVVILVGVVFRISLSDWALVMLAIGLVLTTETMNTACEELCDTLQPEKHSGIRRIKDIAAGAVLLASVISVLVGLCVFVPYLSKWFITTIGSK
jgi:diacylglycerol kinase